MTIIIILRTFEAHSTPHLSISSPYNIDHWFIEGGSVQVNFNTNINNNKVVEFYCSVNVAVYDVVPLNEICANYIRNRFLLQASNAFIIKYDARSVVNLSKHHISDAQLFLLKHGLTICPTPCEPDMAELKRDLGICHRKFKLRAHSGKEEWRE